MDPVLKKRLIGAIVLVALAVIFLPMLIKGPAPDSGVSSVSLDVPEAPGDAFVEIPLAAPDVAPEGGAVGMPVPADGSPAAEQQVQPATAQVGTLPASAAGGDYAVNFGAYATQADADAVAARLKQAGLPAFTTSETVAGREAVRVRIGPYADRAQAEIVRLEALKTRNDVNATVVVLDAAVQAASAPLPAAVEPSAPAPVAAAPAPAAQPKPEPAKPVVKPAEAPKPEPRIVATEPRNTPPAAVASGYAVQVAAFAAVADANALRDKARAAGLSAFVEQVRTDKGVLSRVRIGPVASRAQADALKVQVKAKLGIDGQVRPHP